MRRIETKPKNQQQGRIVSVHFLELLTSILRVEKLNRMDGYEVVYGFD